MTTEPEVICLHLGDGSCIEAMVHIEADRLHVNAGWGFSFVIQSKSARAVCRRLLELLPDEQKEEASR
jgi:hypothetical protein